MRIRSLFIQLGIEVYVSQITVALSIHCRVSHIFVTDLVAGVNLIASSEICDFIAAISERIAGSVKQKTVQW